MKKLIIIFIILMLPGIAVNSQSLVNNGAKIVALTGTSIIIEGSYINRAEGDVLNGGDISLSGNWINDASSIDLMKNHIGAVEFRGPGTQLIEGTSITHFYDILVASTVEMNTSSKVQNQLMLSGNMLYLHYSELTLEAGSNITGAGPLAYLCIIGDGKLTQRVGDWDREFPVGIPGSYCPLILNNQIFGGEDSYSVNVFPDVLDGGDAGVTINEIDHCVNLTWNIDKMNPATTDLSVTAFWNLTDEGSLFDRSRAGMGHYAMGSGWIPQYESIAGGSNPYSLTRSGIEDLSAFSVGDIYSPMAKTLHLTVNCNAYLEGPYNGTDMETDLNLQNLIPNNQPFTGYPWFYGGTEYVPGMPNSDVVDWVLVELRDAWDASSADPSTIMEQKAAFVLRDGTIVDIDGSSPLTFSNDLDFKLFIVLWHRNHLGILSANPVDGIGGIYEYNFSTAEGMAHGGSSGHKELGSGSGVYGMYSGDGDCNSEINLLDKTNVWVLEAGNEGYHFGDFNMDGQVNNVDKNDRMVDNMGVSSKIPK